MSTFTPTIPPIPRPEPAELLGRFVPSALRRTPPVAKIWRLGRIAVLGVFTAGIFPCRALQTRLRKTLMMHAQQCDLASQLLDHHLPADDAATLREAADGVAVSHAWLNGSALLMLTAVATAAVWITQQGGVNWDTLRAWLFLPLQHADALTLSSFGLLSVAYLILILQINRQVVAMQQFALAFNAVMEERVRPIDAPPLVWGLKFRHLLLGGAGVYFGLFWAMPMMLAWAAFADFVRDSAFRFRVQLADRLTTISGVESVIPLTDLCPNPDCRHSHFHDAQFCPRCGTPLQN